MSTWLAQGVWPHTTLKMANIRCAEAAESLRSFTWHISENPFTRHISENPFTWHISENPFTRHISENPFTWHISENPFTWHISENPFTWHISENPFTRHISENPLTRHISENPFTRHISENPFYFTNTSCKGSETTNAYGYLLTSFFLGMLLHLHLHSKTVILNLGLVASSEFFLLRTLLISRYYSFYG
jgi:hypothetical protein